ncbi:MAG: HrpE/YscL family type III secretion apparatus protein [Simkaniaceae bacterium]|nr:HrpE/YscL family type III secretion apparatus protein [Simkaniaceae bacterium]MCF7852392.1 HrpE/YscL family type III secretion apparatus protein [Simkaniaceae bacterium]
MFLFSLIKSGTIHTASKQKIIPQADFSEILNAQEVLAQAKQEREDLLEETRNECIELKKQAEAQGFQKGLEMFNEHILGLENSIKLQRHEMQLQILPLALKASKRIVGEELLTNPETIVHIIQQAIKPATAHSQIKIYVNKDDLENVLQHKDEIRRKFEKLESLTISPRSDVSAGSCIIETEVGIINATLENQWRALEAAFENYMKQK